MPEMSEIPEGRPPATAPASASPAERRRRRRAFWERVYLVACVVGAAALLILRPRLADDQARSAALGGAIGILAAAIVLILLLVRGRRGHDTMLSREMDGVWDERDRAVKRRVWALAGKAAFAFLFILLVMSFTLFPLFWLIRVGFPCTRSSWCRPVSTTTGPCE